jgi:hypothetical protein
MKLHAQSSQTRLASPGLGIQTQQKPVPLILTDAIGKGDPSSSPSGCIIIMHHHQHSEAEELRNKAPHTNPIISTNQIHTP